VCAFVGHIITIKS